MIFIGLFLAFILSVTFILLYVDIDDDNEETDSPINWNNVKFPRYGGAPLRLNHMLEKARMEGDTETEIEVHQLRKSQFRNRRTPAEKEAARIAGEQKFIAKYGKAGELAIRHTALQKKMGNLTHEEDKALIKKLLAEQEEEANEIPWEDEDKPKGGK